MKYKLDLTFIICIISALVFFSIKYNNNRKDIIILTDSIKTMELERGMFNNYKTTTELKLSELNQVNSELYNIVKELKEKPLVVEKISTVIKYDTIVVESSVDTMFRPNDYNYKINWNHKSVDGKLYIDGNSYINIDNNYNVIQHNTSINKLQVGVELIGAITKTKNGLKYNVITNSDNVYISNMEGYMLEDYKPRVKRFGVSIFGGPAYDITSKKFGVGVGVGITYDLKQLF